MRIRLEDRQMIKEVRDKLVELRKLWRPKFLELPQQCASCPFREGNNKEWIEVLNRLAKFAGKPKVTKDRATRARIQIMEETTVNGDFLCHGSVYNKDMTKRALSEHRQCPGATRWHREVK